ncbi:MAG: hypothetical protein Q7I98_07585 [Erysipelotrichaceae bacterium]|nr:hypothetical protein [Erysipelotrichaceae bacterium]
MNESEVLAGELRHMLALLTQEKEMLILQKNGTLEAVVAEKALLVLSLGRRMQSDTLRESLMESEKAEINTLVGAIKRLQEINALLTRQSLIYVAMLMGAVSYQQEDAAYDTYSGFGMKANEKEIKSNWLDRSV